MTKTLSASSFAGLRFVSCLGEKGNEHQPEPPTGQVASENSLALLVSGLALDFAFTALVLLFALFEVLFILYFVDHAGNVVVLKYHL